jgi:hypothetical protein
MESIKSLLGGKSVYLDLIEDFPVMLVRLLFLRSVKEIYFDRLGSISRELLKRSSNSDPEGFSSTDY